MERRNLTRLSLMALLEHIHLINDDFLQLIRLDLIMDKNSQDK